MGGQSTYTKKEWILMVALAAVTLGRSLCASLQAPFYPQEAEKKGATATEYGFVFGIYELAFFLLAPVIGKYVGKVGVELVLKTGILITGTSLIIFGLLTYVEGHELFISLSFIVRIMEAVGTTAIVTSSHSIVVFTFPTSFARVFTVLEIFHGLGYMIGPSIGGYFYEIGGFLCPFAIVGGLVIVNGFIISCILPRIDVSEDGLKTNASIIKVLKVVPIFIDAFCALVQAVTMGFIAALLEPHIRQFGLSPTATGGMFAINSLTYMVVAPLVGILCDNKWNTKKLILFGSVINIAAFLLIGPVPFTPFKTSLLLVSIGLVHDGFAVSCTFAPSFVDAINSAVKYGLPDNIATYALVSGIYASGFALGAFIGPSVAGVLYDFVGFRPATLFVISLHLLLIIAVAWFLCIEKRYNEQNISLVLSEEENLITRDKGADPSIINLEQGHKESLPLSANFDSQKLNQYNSCESGRDVSMESAATAH